MLSLAVWVVGFAWAVVTFAAGMARAARAVGSPRARFRFGVAAFLLLAAVSVAGTAFASYVAPPPGRPGPHAAAPAVVDPAVAAPALAAQVVAALSQLAAAFLIVRAVFRLSAARTLAPLGAYLAVAVANLALLLLVVRPLVAEGFVMPTEGMGPTLRPGDHLSVAKPIEPRRWDVIAYLAGGPSWPGPSAAAGSGTSPAAARPIYCKRVVGLPGERLRFEGGKVYVNDVEQVPPAVVAGRYTMAMADGRAYGPYRDGDTVPLGPDEYFVVGDDLGRSADSRMAGPTTRADVVGVVDLVYWPPGRFAVLR